jgi:DNA polymerase-3 subunit alpha
VIAYQEQVMRIAQAVAGFTLGQADVLRKAMGKKIRRSWRSSAMRSSTVARAGINEKKATKCSSSIEYFAGYGFNKSHSAAYCGSSAYQTAYLKAKFRGTSPRRSSR